MESKNSIKEVKNWDAATISLLSVSTILIIFSFFTPYLFTREAKNISLDFSQTGAIGDTMGIMNPFISLVGIIITFLAFYMQIKANQLQRKIFFGTIENEKTKESDKSKREHINRLNIVIALLNSILKYHESSGKQLHKFIKEEKDNPLSPNIYMASTSSGYHNFLKLDLLETYNSLVYYFQNKDIDWEKSFIQVLEYLDFYDKMIQELRDKYQNHIHKKVETLTSQGEKLNEVMNDIFADNDLKDLTENKIFLQITESETDFEKLQELFLNPIIKSLISKYQQTSDDKYKNLIDRLSGINKKIGVEKFQTINYTQNLEEVYNNYYQKDNDFLKKIKDFIELIKF
ncbi:hypothetical protein R1T16_00625 [Flavobacterium sp. DG1-102-2]|uniref:hypothetical protein n=1 Tax=Flavobacterium sp. DG1-102-2 TaxID=3081663 RepID=UPI00294A3214|nr:hypothetical protein [Flavobacterium sp. DG1-102-2]MDV6166909.1 hypothetical protein [Flavobacterium sp. DG1-102-2]